MTRLAIVLGCTRVDPTAYDGWDGECLGADLDVAHEAEFYHRVGFDGLAGLVNRAATSLTFEHALRHVLEVDRLIARDWLAISFSGHGGQQPDRNGDELDGRDETWCLWDGQAVDDWIGKMLMAIPAGVNVFVATDSCNSGTAVRGSHVFYPARSTPIDLARAIPKDFACNLIHFAGCRDGASSYANKRGGAWTNARLAAHRRARKPLTFQEWFDRAAKLMPRNQRPVMTQYGPERLADRPALT